MKALLFISSIILSIFAFVAISFFLLKSRPGEIEMQLAHNTPLFVNGRLDLAPEPGERRIFLFGLVFLPLISVANYLILVNLTKRKDKYLKFIENPYLNFFVAEVSLILIFLLSFNIILDLFRTKEQNIYLIFHPPFYYLLAFIAIGIYIFASRIFSKVKSMVFLLFGLGIIILSSVYPLMPERYFFADWSMTHHFDQVFGLIIQAIHGRTSLVDFVSQYGVIYPHVAEIFLKFVPFNFLNTHIFFILLIIFSFVFLYLAIGSKSGFTSIYSLLILLALLGISQPVYFALGLRNPIGSLYYQYLPIRVITGSFFLCFVLWYLKKESKLGYILGFLIMAISLLWNADTGVVICGAWITLLCYNTLSKYKFSLKSLRRCLTHFFLAITSIVLAIAAFSLFAYIRSGSWPNWNGLFEFVQIYYIAGDFMAPMPLVGLWYFPVFIYLAFSVHSLLGLFTGKTNYWTKFYLFLSIYGAGIFAYYQGRSFVSNLQVVIYPAILLSGFYLYDFLLKYDFSFGKLKVLFSHWGFHWYLVAAIPMIFLLSHGILNVIVWSVPAIGNFQMHWKNPPAVVELANQIEKRSEYVRANLKSDKIMIIAEDASYIHLHTQTYSSLPYGFYLEVGLTSQADALKKLIKSHKVDQVFVDYNWSNWTGYKLAQYLTLGETDQNYLQKFYTLP
ncbi:hypothetical protein HY029_06260 [Candidatus Gottesmanbacteria bacterium]|nr:hypothetical protein [Candidatus Gottesmanbacteria bacterium]